MKRTTSLIFPVLGLLLLACTPTEVRAQAPDIERFTATTQNMQPEGTTLRIDILRWSTDEELADVAAALGEAVSEPPAPDEASGEVVTEPAEEPGEADESADADADDGQAEPPDLSSFPTVGYVWPSGSSLGFAIKYARRLAGALGSERITLVTDKRLGAYDLEPWSASQSARGEDETFTVIVLRLRSDGTGDGTMSLAAEPTTVEGGSVALVDAQSAPVLLTAHRGQS